jgi:hypothetical protein
MYPIELSCTMLSYTSPPYELGHPNRATLNLTELRCTLLSYADLYWATLISTEQRSSMWATLQPNWPTFCTCTFLQFCQLPECRTVRYWNKGTPVRYRNATVPDWDAGCRNTDVDGIGLDADAQLWSYLIYPLSSIQLLRWTEPLHVYMSLHEIKILYLTYFTWEKKD